MNELGKRCNLNLRVLWTTQGKIHTCYGLTRANGPSRKLGAVTGRPKIQDICQTRLVSCNLTLDMLTTPDM